MEEHLDTRERILQATLKLIRKKDLKEQLLVQLHRKLV